MTQDYRTDELAPSVLSSSAAFCVEDVSLQKIRQTLEWMWWDQLPDDMNEKYSAHWQSEKRAERKLSGLNSAAMKLGMLHGPRLPTDADFRHLIDGIENIEIVVWQKSPDEQSHLIRFHAFPALALARRAIDPRRPKAQGRATPAEWAAPP